MPPCNNKALRCLCSRTGDGTAHLAIRAWDERGIVVERATLARAHLTVWPKGALKRAIHINLECAPKAI